MKDGTSLAKTSELSAEIEQKMMKLPGVKQIGGIVGMNGDNTALIFAVLKPHKERKHDIPGFFDRLFASKEEKAKYGTTLADYKRNIGAITGQYKDAQIVTFVPPAISGMSMFGGFEYQFLDKGNRSAQESLR